MSLTKSSIFLFVYKRFLPYMELTCPLTKVVLKMSFLFPRWDMDSFCGGFLFGLPKVEEYHQISM